jgi:Tol biopolymer transport system component
LFISRLEDGTSTPFATLPGRAFWLRWSPDGNILRFTLIDPVDHTLGLWETSREGRSLRPILSNWTKPSSECCGIWTGDGKYFVFQSDRGGSSDLWRLDGKKMVDPVRVTNGPLSFAGPVTSRIGHRIYFQGVETQSLLQRYDAGRREFVPAPASCPTPTGSNTHVIANGLPGLTFRDASGGRSPTAPSSSNSHRTRYRCSMDTGHPTEKNSP